jgi:hypothetical protein
MKLFISVCVLVVAALGGSVGTAMAGDDGYDGYDWNDTGYAITAGAELTVITPALNVRECASRKGKTCKSIGTIKKDAWYTLTGKHTTVTAPNGALQQWVQIKYRAPLSQGGDWFPSAWVARTSSKTNNKLILLSEEGDGFSWKSCVSTSDMLQIYAAPTEQSAKVDGGLVHGSDRLVVVYDMFRVAADGRTWWPVSREWCDAGGQTRSCTVATGWATDQHEKGSSQATFRCQGWEGYDESLPPVDLFEVDYNSIFAGISARR